MNMDTVSRSFKIEFLDSNGKSGTLTIPKAKVGIDETVLGSIYENFEHVGYTIIRGYYYTTTKGEYIEPDVEANN